MNERINLVFGMGAFSVKSSTLCFKETQVPTQIKALFRKLVARRAYPELSMGWADPWVGLDCVGLGRDFSVFGGLGPL